VLVNFPLSAREQSVAKMRQMAAVAADAAIDGPPPLPVSTTDPATGLRDGWWWRGHCRPADCLDTTPAQCRRHASPPLRSGTHAQPAPNPARRRAGAGGELRDSAASGDLAVQHQLL
jgi:hypothetical protein